MQKINLHSRQKKILSILNAKHGIATGKELSSKIGVSERTIRTDISEMNANLCGYGIQIVPLHGRGYTLSIKDRSMFLELFSEKESYLTKEDRLKTLILRLLRENDWYDLGNLEDDMFVSHTTLEKDIKSIKHRVSIRYPYLQVERKGNLIRFENDERKKRDLFIRFYADNWDYDSKEGIVLRQDSFDGHVLKQVQKVLNRQLMETSTWLDDYAFIYLTLSICVMYFRVKEGNGIQCIPVIEIDKDIQKVIQILNQDWKLPLSDYEFYYLTEIKQQLVFLSERTYSKNYVLENTDLACHHIVDNLLAELLEEYGVDFTSDDKLFVDLDRHVQALKNGIVAPSIQNHVLGDELRKKYPFQGDIAHTLRKKLSKMCEMDLGIEEEDYLLPFVILAEESLYKRRRGKGIPTAVISHYNESMTHYLMVLLKRYYGDVLDLHGPYALHSKDAIDTDEVMLVLTTVQMQAFDQIFKVPVLTVSPMIESTDQMGIDLYLTSLKSTYLYSEPKHKMEYYYPEKLRYKLGEKSNLLEALDVIHSNMEQYLQIDKLPKVDLEKDYYCALPNGFMFCYQICDSIDRTVVSLVDIGKETSCKYVRNVKTVMYMMMPSSERITLGWFYYLAMALAQYTEELKKVFAGKSLEELSINISRNIVD